MNYNVFLVFHYSMVDNNADSFMFAESNKYSQSGSSSLIYLVIVQVLIDFERALTPSCRAGIFKCKCWRMRPEKGMFKR